MGDCSSAKNGGGDRGFRRVQLGERDLRISIDKGLLKYWSNSLEGTGIKDVL